MLLLKCELLGMKPLPERDGFPAAAMVSVWSEATGARTYWAPGDVADELEGLGRRAECVLELAFKDVALYEAPEAGARRVEAVRPKIQRVHSAKEAA